MSRNNLPRLQSYDPRPQDYNLAPLPALDGGAVEAPPLLEALVGYAGSQRFISFHLRLDGRPVVGDGVVEKVGHYGPFSAWTNHPYTWPALSTDESREDPEPHVVLDRLTRQAYAARGEAARQFLADASGEQGGGQRVQRHIPIAELEDDGRSLDPDPLGRAKLEQGAAPRIAEWLGARALPCPSCHADHVARDYEMKSDGHLTCPACGALFYGPPLYARLSEIRALSQSR